MLKMFACKVEIFKREVLRDIYKSTQVSLDPSRNQICAILSVNMTTKSHFSFYETSFMVCHLLQMWEEESWPKQSLLSSAGLDYLLM